jgi:hypothetical protein
MGKRCKPETGNRIFVTPAWKRCGNLCSECQIILSDIFRAKCHHRRHSTEIARQTFMPASVFIARYRCCLLLRNTLPCRQTVQPPEVDLSVVMCLWVMLSHGIFLLISLLIRLLIYSCLKSCLFSSFLSWLLNEYLMMRNYRSWSS